MSFPVVPLALALAEFAPLVARWVGGEKSEKVAQKIVDTAKRLTGEDDPAKILQAMKADPKLVAEFQHAVLKMEHEREMAIYEDRKNARARDMVFIQSQKHNIRADVMVISAAMGLISCLLTITLYSGSLPGEAVGIISTIAGIFGSCLKDAYAFEFGSSRGSKLKDIQLAEATLREK
ncbi:hypothetical protein Bealeia1_01175 [Candidatus Bealeia paramacronuclearis]|uniref:Uncharacterized protein n=1 Tax=Candidatus Bealeia paramacronuclearis TaxID=1921001 RepID=A0ABZ2C5F9_9PROT|nr:hypothetical protein [Candidatus Bealeia paramacronuclearis]